VSDEVKQQLRQYILLACVTFLAGGGGASVLGRPDPFTGTEGRNLEIRLQKQIDRMDKENRLIEDKLDTALLELAAIRTQLVYLNSGYRPNDRTRAQ